MQRETLRPAQQRAIIDRKALAERFDEIVQSDGLPKARAAIVSELQQALALGRTEIANRLRAHPSKGYRAAQEQAFLVDQLVRLIYDYVVQYLYPDRVGKDRDTCCWWLRARRNGTV
jgi:[protein-PII] uridylyltransferase